MPCYFPLHGWRSKTPEASGKRKIVFTSTQAITDMPVTLPCGRCIGCRLEYSRQWAIRCVHESKMHDDNAFITLTYRDENLPENETLNLDDFQRFIKRLRKNSGIKLRYFHCGEYGEKLKRPHYHALIFGHRFDDERPLKNNQKGETEYFHSKKLEETWGLGHVRIGELTFESAAYVSRYIVKKRFNEPEHYEGRKPEYLTMSRRPGIAYTWFQKYYKDVYPLDSIIMRGKKLKPPKYYDNLLKEKDIKLYRKVMQKRELEESENHPDNTHERLVVRSEVQRLNLKKLTRKFEQGEHEA